jgi:putative membrane protein
VKKTWGPATALLGIAVAVALFLHDRPETIVAALRHAGLGLLLAAVIHVLPMMANARDWQTIILRRPRPGFMTMLRIVWIRESINSMLPVARIGGEIVSFRILSRLGVRSSTSIASLVADTQLTLISQLMFTLLAVGYLLTHSTSANLCLAGHLIWGALLLAPLVVIFCLIQHARPFERAGQIINHATSGKLTILLGQSARVDHGVKLIWRRRGVVLRYLFLWQPLQSVATALEIALALHFLDVDINFIKALVIEALIQAVSSAAFFIPGGLGAQEAGFILIGGAVGIDPASCLALAAARRVRDIVIFIPGLIVWQFSDNVNRKHSVVFTQK